ncbi:hypothetical protein HS141_16365 [Cetobacterium somerae]|uniref:hypothetical protein n=1 Tax=Cetobacterium somerae TaxID=188913 RepID=UPI00211E9E50|nr:hypothetical protein [Cetobacterium somerae]MCQ9628494.1 hypothetical protein [Cetobacterium somerae]
MESTKIILSVATSLITSLIMAFLTYHRFVMRRIDKKVDQQLHDMKVEWLKEQIQNNQVNIWKRMDILSEDTKFIKEYLLKQKNKE